jgi:hypothetical protein
MIYVTYKTLKAMGPRPNGARIDKWFSGWIPKVRSLPRRPRR